jgi:hypothetical protein
LTGVNFIPTAIIQESLALNAFDNTQAAMHDIIIKNDVPIFGIYGA